MIDIENNSNEEELANTAPDNAAEINNGELPDIAKDDQPDDGTLENEPLDEEPEDGGNDDSEELPGLPGIS
jgi:hypothetical protein